MLAEPVENTAAAASRGGSLAKVLRWCEGLALYTVAISLPWEIFQRIPVLNLTVTKSAGSLLIACVFARAIRERAWRLPKTGLEWPLLLFSAACAVSALYSIDRTASLYQIRIYASYVLFFYAVVLSVDSVAVSRRLLWVYFVSATAVAGLALICAAGILAPTRAMTPTYSAGLFSADAALIPVRLVAASDDFNEGVFPALMAFAFGLFAANRSGLRFRVRISIYGMLAVLLAAMLVALSRSSLMIAAILMLVVAVTQPLSAATLKRLLPVSVLLLVSAIAALYVYGGGLVYRFTAVDNSNLGRIYGFLAAVEILLQYWLGGAGLSTSKAALAASGYGEELGGAALHNLPINILIETGVVGLAAFLWIWWSAIHWARRGFFEDGSSDAAVFGTGYLALLFSCFWILNVQPFMALSFFPFVFGLGSGPIHALRTGARASGQGETGAGSNFGLVPALAGALLVALVVFLNASAYQETARRVTNFAARLDEGVVAHTMGQNARAAEAFARAIAAADAYGETPIHQMAYFRNAADIVTLRERYQSLDLWLDFDAATAVGAAAFAQGTTYFEMGRFEDAAASFSLAVQADTRYAGARFRLADCLWAGQDYSNALVEYSRAREMAEEAQNGLFRDVRREEETQVEDAIEGAPNDPTALLRVARYRRQEGAWGDAVALYRRVALLEPENAEARVNLNIDVALELDSNIRSIH